MKKLILILSLGLCLLMQACTPQPQAHFQPVNPNATPEAKELLARLYQTVDDGQIISGLHHNQLQMPNYRRDLNRIEDASGKEPLIWGGDVAWDAAKVVEMATEQYHRGHIITLMWHAARPFDRGLVNFKNQTQGEFSDAQWQELVTEGSEMHSMWIAQVDSIAQYLKVLQERNIPVIWRPLHEMNGEWFWWGNRPGPEGYQKVWRMMYDRMTNYHHLNNLLWVWNANAVRETPGDRAMRLEDYYPGGDVVDILATDVYHRDWRQCHHDDLDSLAAGKLIALGELGSLPTPEQLANMPKFAWFMIWTNFAEDEYNTLDQLNAIFSLPNVITFDGTERVAWIHALYRQQGHTGEFFLDGQLIGRNENMPILSEIFTEAPANCWIGKAPFKGDKYLSDTKVADLRIYNYAVSDEEVETLLSAKPAN